MLMNVSMETVVHLVRDVSITMEVICVVPTDTQVSIVKQVCISFNTIIQLSTIEGV